MLSRWLCLTNRVASGDVEEIAIQRRMYDNFQDSLPRGPRCAVYVLTR